MAISQDLKSLLEKIQAHLHLTGEFDPTYRPDTVARNEAAQLYLDLTAMLSTPTQTTKTVGGWHWKSVFHGEVINSGFELGSAKPEFRDTVPGVTFEYTPYYTESCEPEAQESAPFNHPIAEIRWTNAQPEWQLRMLVEPAWPDDTPLKLYQHPEVTTLLEAARYRWLDSQDWFTNAMAAYGCLENIPEDIDAEIVKQKAHSA